jgi:DNA-binding transcriptional MerR regulator
MDRQMPRLDDYLMIAEAAKYLGVCQNTLRNWGASGKIEERRHPINGYRIYTKSDLDRVLENAEQATSRNTKKPR